MLQNMRPMEVILIVGIVLLLFGAKKLPQLAKSVGESMKILKKEVGEVVDSRNDPEPALAPVAVPVAVAVPDAASAAADPGAPVPADPGASAPVGSARRGVDALVGDPTAA